MVHEKVMVLIEKLKDLKNSMYKEDGRKLVEIEKEIEEIKGLAGANIPKFISGFEVHMDRLIRKCERAAKEGLGDVKKNAHATRVKLGSFKGFGVKNRIRRAINFLLRIKEEELNK